VRLNLKKIFPPTPTSPRGRGSVSCSWNFNSPILAAKTAETNPHRPANPGGWAYDRRPAAACSEIKLRRTREKAVPPTSAQLLIQSHAANPDAPPQSKSRSLWIWYARSSKPICSGIARAAAPAKPPSKFCRFCFLVDARPCFSKEQLRPARQIGPASPAPSSNISAPFSVNQNSPTKLSSTASRSTDGPVPSRITSTCSTSAWPVRHSQSAQRKQTISKVLPDKISASRFIRYPENSAADFACGVALHEASSSTPAKPFEDGRAMLQPTWHDFTDGFSPFAILKSVLNELFSP